MKRNGKFPCLLETFFTQRLMAQRRASPHTLASYRDAFRLLLQYAQRSLKKPPSTLVIEDLDVPLICRFLDHLEKDRCNSVRTRNLRLAAIHSFFRFVAFQEPGKSDLIQRVLAIPPKRCDRRLVGFLTPEEVDALLASTDRETWGGRRDYALLVLAIQTGLRVSELTALRRQDITLGAGAHVRCRGKGRKERCTPLTKQTAATMKAWLRERSDSPSDFVFPNARDGRLSSDGVAYILAKHAATARRKCPSLKKKRVSPHLLRHTTAMNLLQAGVGRSVIALWLGHESVETVQIYIDANLAMKQEILEKTTMPKTRGGRYRVPDHLLTFLESL